MATVETKLLTAEEFWEWASRPENQQKRYELDEGEVVEMPPPGVLHGVLCAWITHLLWQFAIKRQKGWVCSNDTGLLVKRDPDTLRGPDIMFFDENKKLDELSPKFSERVPSLIVEVLSPEDRPSKTNRRIKQYLRRGVPLVWCLDPEDRVVTVYRPDREHDVIDMDGEITGEDVLPDCRFRVAELFTLPCEQSSSESTNN